MEKILHVNDDNHNLGGAFLIAYRVEKYLRKFGFSYDYLSMDYFDEKSKFPIPKDDRTYSANLRKNRLFGHILLPIYVDGVLKKNKYKIMHIDTDSAWKALLYAIPAKKNKLKVLLHSHSSGIDGKYKFIKKICENIAQKILPQFVDKYIACSIKAQEWLAPYGDTSKVEIVFNGIDFEEFYFSEDDRNKYRNKYNLQNKLVIGNVAMFSENKNQKFLIETFKHIHAQNSDTILILIGNCKNPYGEECKKIVEANGLTESVIFIGVDENIRQFLCAMDIFVLPSFIEGAPLSLYEAQATGLLSFSSNTLSKETIISDWCFQIDIKDSPDIWAKRIMSIYNSQDKKRAYKKLDQRYSLNNMAIKKSKIYNKMMENNNG